MHKKNSVSHMRTILSDVVTIGFEHMQSLALEIKKLDITPENYLTKSDHDTNRYQMISNILTIMNDMLHPAHNICLDMFPDAKEFIEFCKQNHKIAVQKKLISPNCNCYECTIELKDAK